MRVLLGSTVLAAVLLATCGGARADSMTATGIAVETHVGEGGGAVAVRLDDTAAAGTRIGTRGTAEATSTWDITSSGATYLFSHQTSGLVDSLAGTVSYFSFTVDADTTYSISGSYVFGDLSTASAAEYAEFLAVLRDETASQDLLLSHQRSVGVDGGTFVLGGLAGTTVSSSVGSLSGTLLAGHTYSFLVNAFVMNSPQDGAYVPYFGSGSLTLGVGLAAVPEPASLALLGVGIAALGAIRRRRRAATE